MHDSNNLKGARFVCSEFHRFLSAIMGKATPFILVGQKAERSGILAFNCLSLSPLSFYADFLPIGATHLLEYSSFLSVLSGDILPGTLTSLPCYSR